MDKCPICQAAMVYRYNPDYARSLLGATYAYFCISDRNHMVEDLRMKHAA